MGGPRIFSRPPRPPSPSLIIRPMEPVPAEVQARPSLQHQGLVYRCRACGAACARRLSRTRRSRPRHAPRAHASEIWRGLTGAARAPERYLCCIQEDIYDFGSYIPRQGVRREHWGGRRASGVTSSVTVTHAFCASIRRVTAVCGFTHPMGGRVN